MAQKWPGRGARKAMAWPRKGKVYGIGGGGLPFLDSTAAEVLIERLRRYLMVV